VGGGGGVGVKDLGVCACVSRYLSLSVSPGLSLPLLFSVILSRSLYVCVQERVLRDLRSKSYNLANLRKGLTSPLKASRVGLPYTHTNTLTWLWNTTHLYAIYNCLEDDPHDRTISVVLFWSNINALVPSDCWLSIQVIGKVKHACALHHQQHNTTSNTKRHG